MDSLDAVPRLYETNRYPRPLTAQGGVWIVVHGFLTAFADRAISDREICDSIPNLRFSVGFSSASFF